MENTVISKEEIEKALVLRHKKPIQDKLTKARVAICGLGGLGSAVAISLARAGVGNLHLIDFDVVELTNINRQQYSLQQLGLEKPKAMEEEIRRFSPYINIKTTFVKLNEENMGEVLKDDDLICEAFDVPEEKAKLTNFILSEMPNKILIGASGMAGYESSNLITTRKITNNFYLCGDGITEICDDFGLMAPRVMICASHQSNMIIRLILDRKDA